MTHSRFTWQRDRPYSRLRRNMDMAENRNTINIKSDESGEIKVADEVVAIIAGLAATEVRE